MGNTCNRNGAALHFVPANTFQDDNLETVFGHTTFHAAKAIAYMAIQFYLH